MDERWRRHARQFQHPLRLDGRALQAMYPDVMGAPIPPDEVYPLGIQIGDPNPSLGFHAETDHQNVINLYGQDPAGFYSLVQTIGGAPLPNVPDSEYGDELRYIMGVEKAVDEYSVYITQAFDAGSNAISAYPQTTLAYQLKTVARLIKGGCKTKIYLCNMGGFDTHGDQLAPEGIVTLGGHADLLRNLSDAVKYFFNDLDAMGLGDQVSACTFSEFGRCAKENGSKGTDHGTLAPMFIYGKAVQAGVNGTNVNLSQPHGRQPVARHAIRLPAGVYHALAGLAGRQRRGLGGHHVRWLRQNAVGGCRHGGEPGLLHWQHGQRLGRDRKQETFIAGA